jgi:hypothetical protein
MRNEIQKHLLGLGWLKNATLGRYCAGDRCLGANPVRLRAIS